MPKHEANIDTNIVIDQMGGKINVPAFPSRIISLVPSQTELLFHLGLDTNIVGVTRFCTHPEEKVAHKTIIGGTKDFDISKIKELNPDLIIGNKEENYEKGIAELKKYFPVWMSDICKLDDAYDMMMAIGEITKRQGQAASLVNELKSNFENLSPDIRHQPTVSCAYFIWRKPYMVAASGTFIDHMLGILGVKNVFSDLSRYPGLTAGEISKRNPDVIFLSSEPYAFQDKHIAEFKDICPSAKIMIVDGELFSWYGSRLLHTSKYFQQLQSELLIA
jgi:ABC-type Fe3+-hydroxamate transport system substrate-binding protein